MKKLCLILLCISSAACAMDSLSPDEIGRREVAVRQEIERTQKEIRREQARKAYLERKLAQKYAEQEREIAQVQEQIRRTQAEKERLERALATKQARKRLKGQKGSAPMRRIGVQVPSPLGQTSATTNSDSE